MIRASRTRRLTLRRFEELSLEHMDALYRFARHLTRNVADAEDLVQETYLRAYRNLDKFTEGTSFRAWIFTIQRNLAINRHRAAKREHTVQLDPVVRTVSIPAEQSPHGWLERLTEREIRDALDTLPEKYRSPLILFAVEGFTYKEIARVTDCPIGTVMSRISRGRERLHEVLSDAGGERRHKGKTGRPLAPAPAV